MGEFVASRRCEVCEFMIFGPEPDQEVCMGCKMEAVNSLCDNDFVKNDTNKPRPELIPKGFVMLMAEVMAYGAKKYSVDNWQKCDDVRRYQGAALRHIHAFVDGETEDPESGISHLGHAAASIAMLWWMEEFGAVVG